MHVANMNTQKIAIHGQEESRVDASKFSLAVRMQKMIKVKPRRATRTGSKEWMKEDKTTINTVRSRNGTLLGWYEYDPNELCGIWKWAYEPKGLK
jgi:hypothetical protein